MINKLVLQNFKKHENLTVNFGAGLIALRGANEIGKSTLYNGILYAMFGSRALPMSLAETVTYDKPETSLKVTLVFTYESLEYTIIRSKGGAKITNGAVTAEGQSEVTRFVEKLFGVNADSATKLMIASQNGLRGALESNDAVQLIEKLANIDLIDGLITKMQDQLPCGNTKQLSESLEELSSLVAPSKQEVLEMEPPIKFFEAQIVELEKRVEANEEQVKALPKAQASRILKEQADMAVRIKLTQDELIKLKGRITAKPVEPVLQNVTELRELLTEQETRGQTMLAYAKWLLLSKELVAPVSPEYRAELEQLAQQVIPLGKHLTNLDTEIAVTTIGRINEEGCALCGKLLQEVPEVVAKNSKVDAKVLELTVMRDKGRAELVWANNAKVQLKSLMDKDAAIKLAQGRLSLYVELIETFPATASWLGETPLDKPNQPYAALIAETERQSSLYKKAVTVWETQVQELQAKEKLLGSLTLNHTEASWAEQVCEEYAGLTASYVQLAKELNEATAAKLKAEYNLAVVAGRYQVELQHYEAAQLNKVKLACTLAEYQTNNSLIKKLREARPIVAARLWAIVLASVSSYFSQIRGTPSVVTRSASSFLVDGKPAAGLSGSTLDALGLAIRMALGKTFLPSINFLLLDEPAAGMDDERETAMLGMLATVSYDQVIVVTHSSLADSFAADIVQL